MSKLKTLGEQWCEQGIEITSLQAKLDIAVKALEHQVSCDTGDSCLCCKEIGKVSRQALAQIKETK